MSYRFSGHETFPCRYAWLPKAYRAINVHPGAFADDDEAMVLLGVGKNMARAIRFWAVVTGMAEYTKEGYSVSKFGRMILDPKDGLDPFLEDRRTLWLLHWQLSTVPDEPLFAWDYLINQWPHPEFTRTGVLKEFVRESERLERKLSDVTLAQHFDTFLHTYVATSGQKGSIQEDNLDCPLVELSLIQRIGERDVTGKGRREAIYTFRRTQKNDITPEIFVYALDRFCKRHSSREKTVTIRDVSLGRGSPGRVFQLPEWDIRDRLTSIEHDSKGTYRYHESAAIQAAVRVQEVDSFALLNDVLRREGEYA